MINELEANLEKIIEMGKKIDLKFWEGFTASSSEDIFDIERAINRKLPEDFKLFYVTIGHGYFPFPAGGGIESPNEIINNCHAPYYFISGSMTPGSEWAPDEEQRLFYISYGKENPNTLKFTKGTMFLEDTYLLDLVQIGSDGGCCYHQLNTGEEAKYKYCLLTDSEEIENKSSSFFEGFINYLTDILNYKDE